MVARVDITGQRFDRLVALEYSHWSKKAGNSYWLCKCDCGTIKLVSLSTLRNRKAKSCGCYRKELAEEKSANKFIRTPTWWSWNAMMRRCYDTNFNAYKNYGGRGIKVCKRWHDYDNFLADVGERPDNYTLERKDVDAGYNLENCCWATYRAQANNKQKLQRNNSTGVENVTRYGKRYKARATIAGERVELGKYDTIQEAAIAVKKATRRYKNKLIRQERKEFKHDYTS